MLKAHLLHGIRKRRARLKTGATANLGRVQKWPRMWKNAAIHPLVEMTWLLQTLYPQVKMSTENQLEHEG